LGLLPAIESHRQIQSLQRIILSAKESLTEKFSQSMLAKARIPWPNPAARSIANFVIGGENAGPIRPPSREGFHDLHAD
jgi:hypothetical protein